MKTNDLKSSLLFHLDSLPEEEYDSLTFIAALICNTSFSQITIVDENR